MASVLSTTDIAGYIPGKEPRQCTQVTVLDGKNFVSDVYGPRAAYASDISFAEMLSVVARQRVQALRCNDTVFYGTSCGILRLDAESGLWFPLFNVELENVFWPWSVAYVGKKYYFAQYMIGLWEYDPAANSIRHVKTPVYDNAISLCEAFGRLILLTPTYVVQSAQDAGADLTPMLATGAGAQGVSLIGGTAYRVDAVSDGVLVSTSNGIMKGTKVDTVYVFSWDVLSRELSLFSPSCACDIVGQGMLYIDEHGFRFITSTTSAPSAWEAEISEAFRNEFLRLKRARTPGNVFVYYSYAEKSVFVAFSEEGPNGLCTKAYVYNTVTAKWGLFNHQFSGLFDFPDAAGLWHCGYCDELGTLRQFNDRYVSAAQLTHAEHFAHAYHKTPDLGITIRLVDIENYRYDNAETGVLEYALKQDGGYACDECVDIDDRIDMPVVNSQLASGLYNIGGRFVSDTVALVPSVISWTSPDIRLAAAVAQTEPQAGPVLGGGPALSTQSETGQLVSTTVWQHDEFEVEDDIGFTDCGFLYDTIEKYTEQLVSVNASITFGPLRITDNTSVSGYCSFDFVTFGVMSFGVSSEDVNWMSMPVSSIEDWSNTGADEDTVEDWGVGNTNTYDFTVECTMTDDGHYDTARYVDTAVAVDGTKYSKLYSLSPYIGTFGTLTLRAENSGDFFYVKSMDISGTYAGSLF